MSVFRATPRTDGSPKMPDEGSHAFLDRSATPFFAEVRDLVEDWVARYPSDGRESLVGSLRSPDDEQHRSAFWELYLHEAYTRSGYRLDVHPDVPGTSKHPDFLVEGPSRFYLEAISVGAPKASRATAARLRDVEAVLEGIPADAFYVALSSFEIGPHTLPKRQLTPFLRRWLEGLDVADAEARAERSQGFSDMPGTVWEEAGWRLEFHAFPLPAASRGRRMSVLQVRGPGDARVVDNVSGVVAALDAKEGRYGRPDLPLVVAVMSATEYPTRLFEFEQALFGVAAGRPKPDVAGAGRLFKEGHWLTRQGWRRGHAPQVVTVGWLHPAKITRVRPVLWQTLESGVVLPEQPRWLSRVDPGGIDPVASDGPSLAALFGLPDDWLDRDPEFDV